MSCLKNPSIKPATNSMTTTPPKIIAACSAFDRIESMRLKSPGKATARPINKPPAPASTIANNSVVPCIESHPPISNNSPFSACTAKNAPSGSPLYISKTMVGMPNIKPSAKARIDTRLLFEKRNAANSLRPSVS